ncbi:acylneuraminate cytidylyltransferase family protein [Erwinia pyri]|uniref:Acylneuraminate cytidylyltransferase family protein n=1 Tax=Erwinia pyri TaxID=3062598 RepID=A0AA50DLV3_9GAMM|nr:acylneuraminate cytidylyltransferase family protein [Erwinia sp. DE2]WLS80306.1 acylneuraminate cytidylyltransferase family protein [Erwinia sp. DE2]
MIGGKRILAIVPARKGSKRLKNKNILPLANKPLIAWTLDAANQSKYIDNVFVSTDSQLIADIAITYKTMCPFLRPDKLSDDTATTNDVITHVIQYLESNNDFYDYIILLQPTSPLRTTDDIDASIDKIYKKDKDTLVSLSRCEHSPLLINVLPEDESLKGFLKEENNIRSQDLPTYYRINGSIYIFKRSYVGKISDIYNDKGIAFISAAGSDVDIDNLQDFEYAEYLINKKLS